MTDVLWCPTCGDLYDQAGGCHHYRDLIALIAEWNEAPEVHFPAPRLVERPHPGPTAVGAPKPARGGDLPVWSRPVNLIRNWLTIAAQFLAWPFLAAARLIDRLDGDDVWDDDEGDGWEPFTIIDPETVPKVQPEQQVVAVPLPKRRDPDDTLAYRWPELESWLDRGRPEERRG